MSKKEGNQSQWRKFSPGFMVQCSACQWRYVYQDYNMPHAGRKQNSCQAIAFVSPFLLIEYMCVEPLLFSLFQSDDHYVEGFMFFSPPKKLVIETLGIIVFHIRFSHLEHTTTMSKENINYTRDILSGLSPLVLTTSDNEDDEEHQCVPCTSLLKYDPKDKELNSLLDNNRRWAAAVMKENPYIFSSIAQKQEPKLLWIGTPYNR